MGKIISYGPEEPNFGALGLMNNLRDEVLGTELLFKAGNMSVMGMVLDMGWCSVQEISIVLSAEIA